MRVQERYQDVKSNAITESLFLEEVRKNPTLRKFISNRNTFEEAVNILENKGLLFENVIPDVKDPNFLEMFNESISAWEALEDKAPEVNPFEFEKGWRFEFIKVGKSDDEALQKAKDKAIANLKKDPIFYTKLELHKDSVEHQKKRTDQPLDISKGENFEDKDNHAKPVKVKDGISSEDYLKAAKEKEKSALYECMVKEYADGEESNTKVPTEVKNILKGWDYLSGHDLKGAISIVLKAGKNWDKEHCDSSDCPLDIKKVEDWRKSIGVNENISEILSSEDEKCFAIDMSTLKILKGFEDPSDAVDYITQKNGTEKATKDSRYLPYRWKDVKKYTGLDPRRSADWEDYKEPAKRKNVIDKLKSIYKLIFKNENTKDLLGDLVGQEINFTTKRDGKLENVEVKAISSTFSKDRTWTISLGNNEKLAIVSNGRKGIYIKADRTHEQLGSLGGNLAKVADTVFGEIKESQLKEQIKSILREKVLNELATGIKEEQGVGTDADRENLERELKNYTWYWQTKGSDYEKINSQQRDTKIAGLVTRLGQKGIDMYNSAAPDDCKWGTGVKDGEDEAVPQLHQDLKDMEDMDPKDLAKQVLANKFDPKSSKINVAIQLLTQARQTDNDPIIGDALKKLNNIVNEGGEPKSSTKTDLVKGINTVIDSVDDSLHYEDLAKAIAHIVKDQYGSHLIKPFIDVMKKELET